MNDNDIIKALKCCKAVGGTCEGCAFGGSRVCIGNLHEKALDLINRQQAEKEALIAGQETLQKYIAEQQAEIERFERLNGDLVKIADTRKKANFSLLKENSLLTRELKAAKTEAIKEFAGRLCKERVSNDPVVIAVKAELKEMVGEEKVKIINMFEQKKVFGMVGDAE